uniref:3'-N-debenzoyl-2'-deoxytaxol N-benzoyltransferase n=1 Tax=Cajanus cajan TaxID=3821 RepID=A0A151RV22_CAJCA|nr:3'-N-debenzoyl-2'-deoxytaxol N-benzoyltransferase [Cajanus cajan]
MSDATGLVQFMSALGEIASGMQQPSVLSVWRRELLNARDPLHPSRVRTSSRDQRNIISIDDMTHRSFFFGPTKVVAILRLIPTHQRQCSNFELLTACLWRCSQKEMIRGSFVRKAKANVSEEYMHANGGVGTVPCIASFYIAFKNAKGEEGLIIPVCLPFEAMEWFVKELGCILNNHIQPTTGSSNYGFMVSSL